MSKMLEIRRRKGDGRMKNGIIKFECNHGGCGAVYDENDKLDSGYDGYSDTNLPYCPKCGRRVYVTVDTLGRYMY